MSSSSESSISDFSEDEAQDMELWHKKIWEFVLYSRCWQIYINCSNDHLVQALVSSSGRNFFPFKIISLIFLEQKTQFSSLSWNIAVILFLELFSCETCRNFQSLLEFSVSRDTKPWPKLIMLALYKY